MRFAKNTLHVMPQNDLIEHDDDGDDCVCGPLVRWFDDDGEPLESAVVVHNSLDGREA